MSRQAVDDTGSACGERAAPLRVLLLCDYRSNMAATVRDHIDALTGDSRHHVFRLSMLGDIPDTLDLGRFDAVVVHYSLLACDERYLSARARARVAAFGGLKVQFIQDEYRHVNRTVEATRALGIDLLYTCVPEAEIHKVYPPSRLPGTRVVNTLTGFVPEGLPEREVPSLAQRRVDVGYRAREVPAWLGELGQEKWRIGHRFLADAPRYGLACDISYREEDRLYGPAWIEFLGRCKAVLGVESGASVFDFEGEIQRRVEAHVLREPDTPFGTLRDLYFGTEEGRIRLNQISPRCFEAAAVRTLMILYDGEYSGLLEPWRHYVPLHKDHANMDEVVAVLRDAPRAQAIVDRAYREIALNPAYAFRTFVEGFDALLESMAGPRRVGAERGYDAAGFARAARMTPGMRWRRLRRDGIDRAYRFVFGRMLKGLPVRYRNGLLLMLRRARAVLRGRVPGGVKRHV